MRKFGWFWLLAIFAQLAVAADFLPLWQAFQVKVVPATQQQLWVKFDIAPEYHVYQNKIRIQSLADSSVKLGQPLLPDPQLLTSPDLGTFKVYEGKTAIEVPIQAYGNGKLILQVNYQGCKGLDMCFPEQTLKFDVDLNAPTTTMPANNMTSPVMATANNSTSTSTSVAAATSANDYFKHSFPLVIGGFFVLGLLIAFTPCVFPLLPVLIGVIAGNNISTKRSFWLALSYIIGGAVTYALAGVIAASLGYSLSGYLQSRWLNGVLTVLFAGFGLALLLNFNLQMPLSWQNRLNGIIGRKNHKSLLSAFIIGGFSNLILSPCVTAPLAGALVYISATGNAVLGGSALFVLGLGSGVPLLVIAVFGRKFLPKSGSWMNLVKKVLGLVLVGVALYQLSKIISLQVVAIIGIIWLVISGTIILWQLLSSSSRALRGSIVGAFALIALLLPVYSTSIRGVLMAANESKFTVVTTQKQLDSYLALAQSQHQPVVIDFYADWCIACKEMDIKTFSDQQVSHLMNRYMLIRVDVSENNHEIQQLQAKYQIIAPPSMVFVDDNGQILKKYQVNGFIAGNQLTTSLKSILTASGLPHADCNNDNNKC